MDNGLILLITFSLPIAIVIIFYYLVSKRKKIHAKTLKSDWIKFEKAIRHKHINGIVKYGTELIWNEKLTDSKLEQMSKYIDNLEAKNAELENLKNLIYNKKLDWNKDYVGTA